MNGAPNRWEDEECPSDMYGEQLAADRKIWDILVEAGFSGRLYDSLLNRLARHALDRVAASIHSGAMFGHCYQRFGYRLHAPVYWTWEDRQDVASTTIATGVYDFDKNAKDGTGWDPTRGRLMSSYVYGLCVGAFPNAFRTWLRYDGREFDRRVHGLDDHQAMIPDVESRFEATLDILACIDQLPPPQPEALRLSLYGYTHAEIAARLGCPVGQVAALLAKARTSLASLRRGDARDH